MALYVRVCVCIYLPLFSISFLMHLYRLFPSPNVTVSGPVCVEGREAKASMTSIASSSPSTVFFAPSLRCHFFSLSSYKTSYSCEPATMNRHGDADITNTQHSLYDYQSFSLRCTVSLLLIANCF